MKVQVGIYFRCAERAEVFSAARADALEMRSPANPQKCSTLQFPAWIPPGPRASDVAHVLAGATHRVGAGSAGKTPGSRPEPEHFAFF